MKKFVFLALFLPATALAVDGQILINQATVMAAGGFPYVISQAGSYKLSGNLVMNTSQNGNFNATDIAILVVHSNVTLDLNGFTISIVNGIQGMTHNVYGITTPFSVPPTVSAIAVHNGNVTLAGTGSFSIGFADRNTGFSGIDLSSATFVRAEDLFIMTGTTLGTVGLAHIGIAVGPYSVVRHVQTDNGIFVICPSIFAENAASAVVTSTGCPAGALTVVVP